MLQEKFPSTRMRRLRGNEKIRDLVRETELSLQDFVLPLFIKEGKGIKNPISSMPGHFQMSLDCLGKEIEEIISLKIPAVLLFGLSDLKDAIGSSSYASDGIIQKAIAFIKDKAPDLLVITDVCFCEYTDHGHCGVLDSRKNFSCVDNDATLELLALQAVSHAKAGADIVAPSGMMDGMVEAIRKALDKTGFYNTPILSYAVKYASSLYEAFREAADCNPRFGNRKTYQMDPRNGNEAIREAALDIREGADMIMVKPAGSYLDVIYRISQTYPGIPIGAYHVSSEYAMIKAAASMGWIQEKPVVLEILTSIKRAGASFIISYYSKEVAKWLYTQTD